MFTPFTITKIISQVLKLIIRIVSVIKLKAGFFNNEILPPYDFKSLIAKWPFDDPNCISDSFARQAQTNNNIDLSICIPAFNVENSILTLLNQLENQSTCFNIEILIVNDGSSDKTENIVKEYIFGKEKFRLFNQDNAGLSAARNKAIDNVSGRYLTFIDSDDEICDGFIDNLMMAAISQNADIVIGRYYSKKKKRMHLCGFASSFAWGKVYRTSMFDNIRFPNGYWFEDMINNFLLTPLSEKTVYIDVPLIIHNDIEGSLSKVQYASRNYKSLEQLYLVISMIEAYKTLDLTDESYLHKRIMKECSRLMVRRTEKLDIETKKQVFLACNMIFSMNGITVKEFYGIDRLFAEAIINKDYTAWRMAADYADVFCKFHPK